MNYNRQDNKIKQGNKHYELTDHRGNVMAVVSDKKLSVDANDDGIIDYYAADIIKATDYAPFGMGLVDRSFNAESYRYGYNGKENDEETGLQDYGFRIYNPELGRFLSVDPLHASYPWYSSYHFAGNSPILNVDLDGGEPRSYLNDWLWKDMFVLSSKERVGQYIMITDPKLGKQPIEVNVVYDKTTNQHWFIHKDNKGQYYYLKNETGESDVMNIDHNTNTLSKGHFEKFETQDQIQAKLGIELARGMATSVFGVAAAMSAIPAMTVLGGAPLLSTKASISTRLVGMGSDLLSQYAQGDDINYASVLASGVFKNPFTSSSVGTLFEFNSYGKLKVNSSSEEVLLAGVIGGFLGGMSNKFSIKYSSESSMKINERVATGIGQGIVNFWGNFTAREMQKLLNLSASNNQTPNPENEND